MKKPSHYSESEKRNARKAGFKKKAPKKPRMSSKNLDTMERWVERYNEWVREMKTKASEAKRLESIRHDIRNAKR